MRDRTIVTGQREIRNNDTTKLQSLLLNASIPPFCLVPNLKAIFFDAIGIVTISELISKPCFVISDEFM